MEKTVNTRVIFSAVRKGVLNTVQPSEIITFTDTETNIGNGMNPDTGDFIVPVSGIYSFSLSALTHFDSQTIPWTKIGVYKNGNFQLAIEDRNFDDMKNDQNLANIGFSWMLELAQDDQIFLRMDGTNGLEVNQGNYVWFNGQLLYGQ